MRKRDKATLAEYTLAIKQYFGDRAKWVHMLDGYGGHLRISLYDVSYKDLCEISNICGGTTEINVHHEPASGSEFTPSGDFMEIIVFGPKHEHET